MKIYTAMAKFFMSLSMPAPLAYILPFLLFILLIFILIQIFASKKTTAAINKKPTQTGIPIDGKNSGRVGTRHFDRTEIQEKVSYLLDEDQDPKPCKLVDISLSGLGFLTEEEIEQETRVRFALPNLDKEDPEKSFNVSGKVVRIKKNKKNFEYGIHFFHIMTRETNLLKMLITSRGK